MRFVFQMDTLKNKLNTIFDNDTTDEIVHCVRGHIEKPEEKTLVEDVLNELVWLFQKEYPWQKEQIVHAIGQAKRLPLDQWMMFLLMHIDNVENTKKIINCLYKKEKRSEAPKKFF